MLFQTKGLLTWREEDPKRRNSFSLGLHAKVSVRVHDVVNSREEIKD